MEAAFGEASKPNLVEPIYVVELRAVDTDICLYRLYDGLSQKTALTLGRWWWNRALLRQICWKTLDLPDDQRHRRVLEFLRSAMFVHPSWNYGTNIAQMKIPAGSHIPAIIGRGSWEAMKSSASPSGARGPSKGKVVEIRTEDDVFEKLGMMPIPGPKQVFLPLFNDMWVRGVPGLTSVWPLN